MDRSELDKLSRQLSIASTNLSNKGKFSNDIDNLIDEYEYSGIEDDIDASIEAKEGFAKRAKVVLDKYNKGDLQIKNIKMNKDIIQIRKKNTSKAKPKRKIVKKCKCK